jgi:HSP20 family protein
MTLITRRTPSYEAAFPLQLFDDAFNRFFSDLPVSRPWAPSVDIVENENELVLTADVPGVPQDQIDIRIEDGTLTLSGERKFENQENKGGYHRMERSDGSFKRLFNLPDSVDPDRVAAAYDNGVLRVTLPKKEIAKPKTIKVALNGHK